MSKKPSLDSVHMPGYINQSKISRNDRFAQMSHQEKLIEQKKKEILAKLEAKRKATKDETASSKSAQENKSKSPPKESKSGPNLNLFSNDGSFLDTFKQIKDKRFESKLKSFKAKDNSDRSHSDSSKSSYSRWSHRKRSPSPKNLKSRVSRFDKTNSFEQKITINTSFSTSIPIQSCQEPPISVTSSTLQHAASLQQLPLQNPLPAPQPLLEEIQQPSITFQEVLQSNQSIIAAPPILLNVPPPQIVQAPVVMQQPSVITVTPAQGPPILTASQPTLALPQSVVLTTVTLSPTTIIASQPCAPVPVSSHVAGAGPTACIQTMELSSIPPPSPIQVQNIPQPEPLNTLNIPPPAPLQVQNIPTPASIQLNEIPNPKPIDILAIPTPTDDGMSNPEFIKNIPPPNKSIPPPSVTDGTSCLTLPGLLGQSQTIGVQSIATGAQGVVLHNLQSGLQPGSFGTITSISVGVLDNSATLTTMSPSLVPQPVLPPAGVCMNQPPPLDVSCPPPMLSSAPPPMPHLNMPPPIPPPIKVDGGFDTVGRVGGSIPDINAVFTPGTAEYEAMASLGRMVVQCGSGFEDIVRQRKDRDPNLWFLFHKDSAAYHQYQLLIETFRAEMIKTECPSHDDRYDPEAAMTDVSGNENGNFKRELQPMDGESSAAMKRKRRSRWGEKAIAFPAQPGVATVSPQLSTTGGIMLTKITRQDPGLIQYALQNYGRQDLTEEEWCKVEDHYKIKLLHQDMLKKRQEVEKLQQHGKNKYEYDSDEEIDGGTWEHKLREKEMLATQLWAQELTRQAEGKHHIGDFLPPEELNRFMEKHTALKEGRPPDLSDYKDFKIKEDNVGFRMLQKLGWTEGQSLGATGTSGIIQPIDKAPTNHEMNQGLGMDEIIKNEDEYESYRRRMMLAYRFRPNPLNNPRRPYY